MHRMIVIAALALTGCSSSALAPTTPFSRELTIANGATERPGEGVAITFVEVAGDSRCPGDAICIQGGDAVVKLQVRAAADRHDVELHTGTLEPVKAGDLTLELLQLDPYPFSSHPIRPSEYRATLRVTR